MSKGGEAPHLVAMVAHGEGGTWTIGGGFISKEARWAERRIKKRE